MRWTIEERVSRVPTGRVKWYDAEKGFGFLAQDGGEDVYVRKASLPPGVEALKQGQRVGTHVDVASVVLGQEPEALLGVVPLHLASRHG